MSLDVMHAGIAARVWLPADVPVELGREEARELARRELADPAYDAAIETIVV